MATATTTPGIRQTGVLLDAEQMAALDEIARALRLRSRSAAIRLIVTLGLAEWERQQQAAAQRQ